MTVKAFIDREKSRSTVSKKLYSLLIEGNVDEENICGILADLETDEERQILTDYIEKGENINEEQLVLNAIWIAQQNGH